jgi:hypothetical protein
VKIKSFVASSACWLRAGRERLRLTGQSFALTVMERSISTDGNPPRRAPSPG